jgi:hypothetical protein
MNEDALPADLPKDFDLEQYIIPTRLTDATLRPTYPSVSPGKVVFC